MKKERLNIELNTTVNNEGMDVKMINAKLGLVVKGLGLNEEVVRELAAKLGLVIDGKLILNVKSTASVIDAMRQELAKEEVVVAEDNNEVEIEGMDVNMMNNEVVNNEVLVEVEGMDVEMVNVVEGNELEVLLLDEAAVEVTNNANAAVRFTKEEKIAAIKRQLSQGIATVKMMNYILRLEGAELQEMTSLLMAGVHKRYRGSYRNRKAVKHNSKDIPTCLIRRVEINPVTNTQNGTMYMYADASVQPTQESELLRAIGLEVRTMGDTTMSLTAPGTEEIITLSLGKDLLKNVKLSYSILRTIFNMITSMPGDKITVIVSASGIARVVLDSNYTLGLGEVAREYELLGVTPSGLRTGSLVLAAVTKIEMKNGKIVRTNIDSRVDMLDKSSDGAFKLSFIKQNEDGTFVTDNNGKYVFRDDYKDTIKLFKEATRILMVSTASKRVGDIETYVVFSNIAEKASYNKDAYNVVAAPGTGVNCEDTQDGHILASVRIKKAYQEENNSPASVNDLIGNCNQSRGGGTKDAVEFFMQKDIITVFNSLVERGTTIEYIVFNGEKITIDELKANNQFDEFLNSIDVICDANAMKLLEHNLVWTMLDLKPAYASETSLNMVINIAMLFQDSDKAKELLLELGQEQLFKMFKEIGAQFIFDADGAIEKVEFDFDKLQAINNDPQVANWLYKQFPKTIAAAAPQILKSIQKNASISIKNLINTLSINVESLYMVVQADMAPLFGLRLLDDGEVFNPQFSDVEFVSGARHPISGPFAVSTFAVKSEEELIKRINDFKCSDEIKDLLIRRIATVKDFVIVPADHYIMEKHDGMDWDIDAMQFFKEERVVEILKGIPEIGTKIDRDSDKELGIMNANSADELAIKEWKERGGKLERSVGKVVKKTQVAAKRTSRLKVKSTTATGEINKSSVRKNANGCYSIDFDSVANLIFDFFSNPIDPVGFIATGFYNNALLYRKMTDADTTKEEKEMIANIIAKEFGCSGHSSYSSPIVKTSLGVFNGRERVEITLNKSICTEVMMRLAESEGSVNDVTAFLYDACLCNRYPAETSIDAAKNNYAIVDMFNLGRVIKALGSDKNMKTKLYGFEVAFDSNYEDEMVKANTAYDEIVDSFNDGLEEGKYPTGNFFKLGMLYNFHKDAFLIDGMSIDEIELNKSQDKIPAVTDPLAEIRNELLEVANELIVLTSKELENYVRSAEAKEVRTHFIDKYVKSILDSKKEFFKADTIINSMVRMYLTVTDNIKTTETKEIDDMNARTYMKTTAIQACRNFATLAFKSAANPLTDEQIGCAVMYTISSAFNEAEREKSECRSLNTALLDIFGPELVAFLKSDGFDVKSGEKVLYAINENNRQVKLEDIVGSEVSGLKGHGEVAIDSDIFNVVFDNKKATVDGIIENHNGKYFAMAERQFVEPNTEVGVYVPAKTEVGIASKEDFSLSSFIDIQFKKVNVGEDGEKRFNLIVGTTEDNREVIIAELYVNAVVSEILNKLTITEETVRFFKSEKSLCVHFMDAQIMDEVAYIDAKTSVAKVTSIGNDDSSFFGGSDFGGEIVMPEAAVGLDSSVAAPTADNFFDGIAPVV